MADPPAFTTIRYEVEDAIAIVTLDRPEAFNALTVTMRRELLAAFRQADRDGSVRVVVLTGAGRAFCAGQDLKERLEPGATPLLEEIRERYNPLIRAMRRLRKPIIAAINGVAAGAGAALALACDLRIAAEGSRIDLAFGRVGLIPDSGTTWALPRLVGASKAAELALLNEPLPAEQARQFGLVAKVVPASALMDEARAMAGRLAELAPVALMLTKRALEYGQSTDLDSALEYEAMLQGVAGRTAGHAEGLRAFVEKRPPRFTGE